MFIAGDKTCNNPTDACIRNMLVNKLKTVVTCEILLPMCCYACYQWLFST